MVTFQQGSWVHNVSKVVLRDRHNISASFSEDDMQFSWQARRGTLDVSRCIFFLRIALSGLRHVVTTRKSRVGLLTCQKIDGCVARNIDFDQSAFRGFIKTLVGKRRLCSYKL